MSVWRRRPVPSDLSPAPDTLRIDFPACVEREFPRVFAAAWAATEAVLQPLDAADLSPLARHSPGLLGYDWRGYLRCSAARVARVAEELSRMREGTRVLDVGAYFGNFSRVAASMGFSVDALDAFRAYGDALRPWTAGLETAGAHPIDFADVGLDLHGLPDSSYDAVLVMGVLEHVPHSPRQLLRAVHRVLKPGGSVVLDTPNIAYLYNRERLARGESIMPPLASQFDCEPPFEGHHREYTMDEVRWMLERTAFEHVVVDAFNYSLLALETLQGHDLELYRRMMADPAGREVIFATARTPNA
jgi:SAM-dependent methyltransferase